MKTTRWAICGCGKKMAPGSSCDLTKGVKGKKIYKRIPFGSETRGGGGWGEPGQSCHDCNAAYGSIHHAGCDIEECPVCHQQMLGCDCITHLIK